MGIYCLTRHSLLIVLMSSPQTTCVVLDWMPCARDNGVANRHPLVAWRFAPRNQRMKPTSGGKACGSPALCGLSAAPLGYKKLGTPMKEDYIDKDIGWRIQLKRKNETVDYVYKNLVTKEKIKGGAMEDAFKSPRESIAQYLDEKERTNTLRKAGVLGEQIARKIIEMIALLHKRVYESLYLDSCMAPSGMYWRYKIGAMVENRWPNPDCYFGNDTSSCVSGSIGGGFEQKLSWANITDTIEVIANKFQDTYPIILNNARCSNTEYVSWYKEMLKKTSPEGVLIFSCDYGPDYEYAFTWGEPKNFQMPMPPGFKKNDF